MRLAGNALLLGLLAAGCAESQTCEPGYCGPHGTCVVVDGQLGCACDEGYEQGEGLSCVAVKARMGEACQRSEDCADGLCWGGYCTRTGCSSHGDCVNLGADRDATRMCCAEYEADLSMCIKIAPGFACGQNDQPCGASCTGAGDSACAPGTFCLGPIEHPSAVCALPCSSFKDCRDCRNPEDPGAGFGCSNVSGRLYCVERLDSCERNADCAEWLEACGVRLTLDGELVGDCGTWGELPTGAECDYEGDQATGRRCMARYCLNGYCSAVCRTDADCPSQMTCEQMGFPELTEDTIRMCVGPGDARPGDPCPLDGANPQAEFCQAGLDCLTYEYTRLFPCEEDRDCEKWIAPGHNPDCIEAEGVCGSSFCAPRCEGYYECEEGYDPDWFRGCYCVPYAGDAGPGEPCPFLGVNLDADFCRVGLRCLGYEDTERCDEDEDCWYLSLAEHPDCTADGLCGVGFCSAPCDYYSGYCEDGFYPGMVDDECYCIPYIVHGHSGPGDACPFEATNEDADYCASGLSCLGYDTLDVCETDEDCERVLPLAENPDCTVYSKCGASFCTLSCDVSGGCDEGFHPIEVEGMCYCAPE
ncbi:MAG: hypothetical protein JXR96_11770 [Deltaproteobacteria bacterium]|nr:hypothetical protein [Deltaproteobacteria bacterium]